MSYFTGKRAWLWRGLAVAAAVAALALLWKLAPVVEWSQRLMNYVDGLGFWAPLIFAAFYVPAAMVGIPRTALNIGAGILFSLPIAFLVVFSCAAIDFYLSFELGRHFIRDWVKKRVQRHEKVATLMQTVEEESFKLVFMIRLNPFIPAVTKGYGFGTTPVPLTTYMLASLLGFLPIGSAHIYLGWLGGRSMMHASERPDTWQLVLFGGGAVVSVAVVAVISWYGNRALKRRYRSTQEEPAAA